MPASFRQPDDCRHHGQSRASDATDDVAFESYLLANRNTEKPILHISLNPSPEDKLTDAQFANLAKEYMDKMGYGDQPYIVYMHEDIGRRISTSFPPA